MADQMNRNQGSNKSMPSQNQDQRRSSSTQQSGTGNLGNQQQQRNQKGTSDVSRNAQKDIEE